MACMTQDGFTWSFPSLPLGLQLFLLFLTLFLWSLWYFFKYLFLFIHLFGCSGSQLWHAKFLVASYGIKLMRDQTWAPALGAQSLNHWTTREVSLFGISWMPQAHTYLKASVLAVLLAWLFFTEVHMGHPVTSFKCRLDMKINPDHPIQYLPLLISLHYYFPLAPTIS